MFIAYTKKGISYNKKIVEDDAYIAAFSIRYEGRNKKAAYNCVLKTDMRLYPKKNFLI